MIDFFAPMHKPLFWLFICFSLTLSACNLVLNNLPGVYKLDIEQGNIVDQNMVDQLRPNMTKRQVTFIMGSPMLSDNFHENRWDYLYSKQVAGDERVQKRVSLFFKGDNLIGVQGDFRPSSMPKQLNKEELQSTLELPKRELEKSMSEKLSGWFGLNKP